jgi:hypothetical protein
MLTSPPERKVAGSTPAAGTNRINILQELATATNNRRGWELRFLREAIYSTQQNFRCDVRLLRAHCELIIFPKLQSSNGEEFWIDRTRQQQAVELVRVSKILIFFK